jgi:hypothetical protein
MAKGYKIKNWEKFQHYSARRPPWIKLYTECIEDYKSDGTENDFHKLSDSAKLTCMLLWLLGSKFDGKIPCTDEGWLKNRLGIKKVEVEPLLSIGFIESYDDASKDAINIATAISENASVSVYRSLSSLKGGEGGGKGIRVVDENWLNSLRPDCEKQGINLDDQVIKMKRWLSLRPSRKFTQKFVINWLNKVDRTIETESGEVKKRSIFSQ